MSFKDLIILKRVRFGVYSFTLFLVLIAGAALVISMDLGQPIVQVKGRSPAPQKILDTRAPASVSVAAGLPEPVVDGAPITMEIDCSDLSPRPSVAVRSAHLRLKTKGCQAKAIINTSNGFQATIFKLGEKHFSSDYISLSQGDNQLALVQETAAGEKVSINLSVLSQ